jgi:putative transcriptional regulator
MKTVRMKIEPNTTQRVGRVNTTKLDATTETQIAAHAAEDDAAAMQDAAKFARRVQPKRC